VVDLIPGRLEFGVPVIIDSNMFPLRATEAILDTGKAATEQRPEFPARTDEHCDDEGRKTKIRGNTHCFAGEFAGCSCEQPAWFTVA
jgi:hypothetical protein